MLEEQDFHFKVTHLELVQAVARRRLVHAVVVLLEELAVLELLQQ
tara:strand:- start:190 stop:324 length:135 start_codon:yes stop_codon:yes gene_type:complete